MKGWKGKNKQEKRMVHRKYNRMTGINHHMTVIKVYANRLNIYIKLQRLSGRENKIPT